MLKIAHPPISPDALLSACINGFLDQNKVNAFQAIFGNLSSAGSDFYHHATVSSLHLLPQLQSVGAVSKSLLLDLYDLQMSAARGGGRSFYDVLRNSAPNGICPLCGIGCVTTLDHHLPKSKYPNLAVCLWNLVPACDFCNRAKGGKFPSAPGEQTIHPYFDDFETEQWISAYLDHDTSPALIYYVDPPANWPPIQKERAQRHFDVVKLGINFTSNANHDMITLRDQLLEIETTKGVEGVWEHLDGERRRYSRRINSWQHVMYKTLLDDGWFFHGGYRDIPT